MEHGESDRSAADFAGLCRRTFERWCRGCPALAAKHAARLMANDGVCKKMMAMDERMDMKAVAGKQRRMEVVEFAAMVCRVRLTVGNAKRQKRMAR